MRAIVVNESGSADVLRPESAPEPTIRPGWVLVRVRAAGVCFRDVVERRGGFAFIKRPVIPGHEFAGEVLGVGPGVEGVREGDRVVNLHRAPCGHCSMCRAGHRPRCRRAAEVFGLSIDGSYAEAVLAPAGCLVHLPPEVSFEHGCFLNCTAAVALRALDTVAKVLPGERVLVTGASGGVGIHALQVAKALGARVLAVTRSSHKAGVLRSLGADEVLVCPEADFHKQAKRATDGLGVEVVLDCVGAPTLNASMRSLDVRGRLVLVGNVTPERFELNAGYAILSELQLLGSAGSSRDDLQRILEWVCDGRLTPVLAQTLPLARAAEAHRLLEAGSVVGRIVLTP